MLKKKKTNLIGSAQEKFIRCYTTHQCKHSCSVDSFPRNNSRIQPLLSCTLAPFQPRSSVSSWQRKEGRNCPLASSQLFLEITHIPCAYIPFVQISFFLPFSPSFFHHLYFLFSATPHSLQDPSSPTRYWTQLHRQRKHQVLTNRLPGNSPIINLFSREGGWEISKETAL